MSYVVDFKYNKQLHLLAEIKIYYDKYPERFHFIINLFSPEETCIFSLQNSDTDREILVVSLYEKLVHKLFMGY